MENKKIVLIIILLIIICLGLGGYIIIDKFVLKEKDKIVTTEINGIDINLNAFEYIENTISKLNNAFNDPNSTYFGYIYSKKELNVKNFDKQASLYAAIYNDYSKNINQQIIAEEVIKTKYAELFGKKMEYKPNTIKAGQNYNIVYDDTNKIYTVIIPSTYSTYQNRYIEKVSKTILTNDKITIQKYVFYVEYENVIDGKMATKANIYTSHDKTKLIGTFSLKNGNLDLDEIIGKNSSKIPLYAYIFQQTSYDKYDFFSIEKIR